jgi:hypothetical protein
VKRRELIFITTALILGAVLGGLIGELIASFLPPGGAQTLLSKSIVIGFDATKIDFYAISFTIGLMVKINLMSLLLVSLVIIYFRKWYF